MAVSALAAIASAAGSIGASVAWSVAASYAISTTAFAIIAGAVTAVVVAGAATLARKIMERKGRSAAPAAQERKQMIRSAVAPRTIVYGQARVSGPIVFAHSTGDKNKFLHMVIVLASHEVQSIDQIWFNDERVTVDAEGWVISEPYASTRYDSELGTVSYDGVYGLGERTIVRTESEKAAGTHTKTLIISSGWVLDKVTGVFAELPGYQADDSYQAQNLLSLAYSLNGNVLTYTVPTGIGTPKVQIHYQRDSIDITSRARIKKHLGSPDQVADADLIAECGEQWTEAHRLRGLAYIYVRLEFDQDAYPTGLPNISAEIKGKKVFNPWTGLSAYSDVWALCVRDYLTSTRGLGCTAGEIDDEMVKAAVVANTRYRINGVVSSEQRPIDVLNEFAAAGAGQIVWSAGKYRLYAGADRPTTTTLTTADLRGPVKVQAKQSRQNLMNSVRATYVDGEYPGKWIQAEIPPITVPEWITQDGNEEVFGELALNYTINRDTANYLATVALRRARQGVVCEMQLNLRGFKIAVGDIVAVTLGQMGWDEKRFMVERWSLAADGMGVDVVLREFAAADFDATPLLGAPDPAPDTSLPKPWVSLTPNNVTVSEELYADAAGNIRSRAIVNWQPPALNTASSYRVMWTQNGTVWASIDTTLPGAVIDNVRAPGFVQARVMAYNTFGVLSGEAWSHAVNFFGKTAPPPTPDFLRIEVTANGARRFDFGLNTPPLDLAGYQIRYNAGDTPDDWDEQTPMHTGTLKTSPLESTGFLLGQFAFTVRAIDTSGNLSAVGRNATTTFTVPASSIILSTTDARESNWT